MGNRRIGSFARTNVKMGDAKMIVGRQLEGSHYNTQRAKGSGRKWQQGRERFAGMERHQKHENRQGHGFAAHRDFRRQEAQRHPQSQQELKVHKDIIVLGEEPDDKAQEKQERYFGKVVIACDVGATKILAAAFTPSGKIVRQLGLGTPKKSKKLLLDAIASTIDRLGYKKTIGIGVCVPGFVKDGIVYGLPNIGIAERFDFAAELGRLIGKKVEVENDSKCFAIAESRMGAGKGVGDMIAVNFGTGIGGGVIIGSRLYRGSNNMAGEFGHMKMTLGGPACGCGGEGCFERYASGSGIVGRFADAAQAGAQTSLFWETATAAQILESQDQVAVSVSRNAARIAGRGVASLANAFNPKLIVVGGPVAQAYQGKYKKEFDEGFAAGAIPVVKNTPIALSRLEHPSLVGAMLIASQPQQKSRD